MGKNWEKIENEIHKFIKKKKYENSYFYIFYKI